MEDLLYKYMSQRFNDSEHTRKNESQGPVLTISRAAGCTVSHLVNELAKKLNENNPNIKWEVINKEILHRSAEILKMHPEKIKTVFDIKSRNFFDEVVQTFISGDYQLEKKMIKTVVNVIYSSGVEGHKIIVGRGANIICSGIKDSLHVRIDAPLNWRVEQLEKNKNMSIFECCWNIRSIEINVSFINHDKFNLDK